MRTKAEITATRRRLLEACAAFGARYNLAFAGREVTAEQTHYMALGALAFADDALALDRPDDLGKLIAAMERENERADICGQEARKCAERTKLPADYDRLREVAEQLAEALRIALPLAQAGCGHRLWSTAEAALAEWEQLTTLAKSPE